MLIELSAGWVITLNIIGWVAIQLGLAWAFTEMPAGWFRPGKTPAWERAGRFYDRVCRIKRWKDRLPDGARWFRGGFPKGRMTGKDAEYRQRFIRETWRGELCHWCVLACAPLFFLWNPWWGDLLNVAYALAANLPCILVQRYNRARLQRRSPRSPGQILDVGINQVPQRVGQLSMLKPITAKDEVGRAARWQGRL